MATAFDVAFNYLRTVFRNQDADALAVIFLADNAAPDIVQLRANLQSRSFESVTASLEGQNVFSTDSRLNESIADAVRHYFRYVRDYDTPIDKGRDSAIARMKRDITAFSTLTGRISDVCRSGTADWLSTVLSRICVELARRARQADELQSLEEYDSSRGAVDRFKNVISAAGVAIAAASRAGVPTKTPPKIATTAFVVANLSFSIYSRNNFTNLFPSVSTAMRVFYTLLDAVPKAQSVEFRYWTGKYHLISGNIYQAREILLVAFNQCLGSSKNRRLILTHLVPASLVCGYTPSQALLQAFDLTAQYQPIIDALRTANGPSLENHINSLIGWLTRHGLYLFMKEKMNVLLWISVFRKTAMVIDPQLISGNATTEVPLAAAAAGFRIAYNDPTYDVDDIEMMAAALYEQGYLRGGIALGTATFNKMRFPPIATVSRPKEPIDLKTMYDLYSAN